MSTESNKQVVMRFIDEAFNGRHDDVIEALVSPNYRSHGGEMAAEGIEAARDVLAGFRTAFPDGKLRVEHILAEGDKVMTWAVFTGTQTGPLEALPPTGKRVEVTDVDLWRLEGGMIAEVWTHFDQPGMLQQLGVLSLAEGE